jgi:DNA-binding MarR family transcriptional regulator
MATIEVESSNIIKNWAYSIQLMKKLYKEDNLYLDELYLLSLIFQMNQDKGRAVTRTEVGEQFNVLSYKFRKMVDNLISRGLVHRDPGIVRRFPGFRLTVTPLGEQILIKYQRAMVQFCEGSK